jgi:hypothetical protein
MNGEQNVDGFIRSGWKNVSVGATRRVAPTKPTQTVNSIKTLPEKTI